MAAVASKKKPARRPRSAAKKKRRKPVTLDLKLDNGTITAASFASHAAKAIEASVLTNQAIAEIEQAAAVSAEFASASAEIAAAKITEADIAQARKMSQAAQTAAADDFYLVDDLLAVRVYASRLFAKDGMATIEVHGYFEGEPAAYTSRLCVPESLLNDEGLLGRLLALRCVKTNKKGRAIRPVDALVEIDLQDGVRRVLVCGPSHGLSEHIRDFFYRLIALPEEVRDALCRVIWSGSYNPDVVAVAAVFDGLGDKLGLPPLQHFSPFIDAQLEALHDAAIAARDKSAA